MSVSCQIRNYNLLQQKLEDMKKAPRKVMTRLTADAKKRVPGWVAAEVTNVYGVKKREITGQKIGKVKIKGKKFNQVKIIYTGRVLTPTHFSMTPKVPKPNRGSYTLKATIINGQRSTLGKVKKLTKKQRAALVKNFTRSGTQKSDRSPVMLMRANGGHYLPFQRQSKRRNDIVAVKTVSLPQMVSGERTHDAIQNAINEGIQKRFEHHMDRYMGNKKG